MVERIKAIMAHYQLRAAQFSDTIGMQRSAVSHVLSGRNNPSLDFVLRIKKHFPEISLNWLLLGEGQMFGNDVSSPASGSQDLFTGQPSVEKVSEVVKDVEDNVAFPENPQPEATDSLLRDEEQAYYGVQKSEDGLVQVLFVYADGTFRVFKPKK